MQQQLTRWLAQQGWEYPGLISMLCVLFLIFIISLAIHIFLQRVARGMIERHLETRKTKLNAVLVQQAFRRIAFTLQGLIVYVQAELWLSKGTTIFDILRFCAQLWMLLLAMLSFFTLLDLIRDAMRDSTFMKNFPIRGIMQSIKLAVSIIVGILIVSMLIGKSPLLLLSGLGAMTAVLLLVFKDPILGLASGIQLSANNMLSVGDWLEMPGFDANGTVIDIGLTTVKVRNWDNTITSIPTYALISNAFKNWRGMTESGGRRIQRSMFIDIYSIHFLSEEEIAKLRKISLLESYFSNKLKEIEEDNKAHPQDMSCLANGRRLTNIGVFRAYLVAYLKAHPAIRQDMTLMVRQMDPTPNGSPLEIYAFSGITDWVPYEGIKTEIFEHAFAVISEFGLRVHQYAGDSSSGE